MMRVLRLDRVAPCHVCGAEAVVQAWGMDLCLDDLETACAEMLGPSERAGVVPVHADELLTRAERGDAP